MSPSVLSIYGASRSHVNCYHCCRDDSTDGLCARGEEWSGQRGLR